MFGLSFSKVLLTAIAIALVWYGWKWMNRVQARRRAELEGDGRRPVGAGRPRRFKRHARNAATEDLVRCPSCQTYVPAEGGGGCDRADCPYSR